MAGKSRKHADRVKALSPGPGDCRGHLTTRQAQAMTTMQHRKLARKGCVFGGCEGLARMMLCGDSVRDCFSPKQTVATRRKTFLEESVVEYTGVTSRYPRAMDSTWKFSFYIGTQLISKVSSSSHEREARAEKDEVNHHD